MNTTDLIERYNLLREACYKAARANDGELMGEDRWLRFAMDETDFHLCGASTGICVTGSCFSNQTQSNEWFDFVIPWDHLPEDFVDKPEATCRCGKPMSLHVDSRIENPPAGAVISHPGTEVLTSTTSLLD